MLPSLDFDYVVIGAGSSGAVVAARLSESGRHRVALVEAGSEGHWLSRVPAGVAHLVDHPTLNWNHRAESEASLGGRTIAVPRGRVVGGSSAINGMVWVRGQAEDFDHWAQLGNRGWSHADVLPYFRRLEAFDGGEETLRGRDGPVGVATVSLVGDFERAVIASAEAVGVPHNPDYNGAAQEGIGVTQATVVGGERMSVARAYLEPAKRRGNLALFSHTTAERLEFDGSRCTGVAIRGPGGRRALHARREVVLSAGAIQSPLLLERSGIGDPGRLESLGIACRHRLPGVGENLRDHLSPRMGWSAQPGGVSWNDRMGRLGIAREGLRWLLGRSGFLALPVATLLAFVRTREGLAGPDVQIHFLPYSYTADRRLDSRPGITVMTYQLRPESTGSVHASSASPDAPPDIRFNFLATPNDRATTVAGVRVARRIMAASPVAALLGREYKPGPAVEDDEAILDWVRASAETAYHPVGTCAMGDRPESVVSAELRVHGVDGLRVADASVMPTLVSGNTNAACIMIGEKAAALVAAARDG